MRETEGTPTGNHPGPAAPPFLATSGVAAAAVKPKAGMKAAVGTAVAAATLAAVTVLSGPVIGQEPASILSSPVNSASSRIAGVQADMARAVALRQVTAEQAAFLEKQLVSHIQADTRA